MGDAQCPRFAHIGVRPAPVLPSRLPQIAGAPRRRARGVPAPAGACACALAVT